MRIIWTARAKIELDDIGEYVAAFNVPAALALVRKLRSAARQLASHPQSGRPGRVEDTRELLISGTPYILPSRVGGRQIEILAVIHTSRQWPDQL